MRTSDRASSPLLIPLSPTGGASEVRRPAPLPAVDAAHTERPRPTQIDAFVRAGGPAVDGARRALATTLQVSAPAANPLYVGSGPDWQSVEQRRTDDCWFVSTVLAIARDHPAAIQQMIRDNGNGTYTVTFGGANRSVTVTPPDPSDERYSRSNGCWLAVMEKAWGTVLAERGPADHFVRPQPGTSPKVAWERADPLGRPSRVQTLDVERRPARPPDVVRVPRLDPAGALHARRMTEELTLDVGNPGAGLAPFFSDRHREMQLVWRPHSAVRALIPVGSLERALQPGALATTIEEALAGKRVVTAATNVDNAFVGGVATRRLTAGHVYAVIGFSRDRNNVEGSFVRLRDPYGPTVTVTLEQFRNSVGFLGVQRP